MRSEQEEEGEEMKKSLYLMLVLTVLLVISVMSESYAAVQTTEVKSSAVLTQTDKQGVEAQSESSDILVGVAQNSTSPNAEKNQVESTLTALNFPYVEVNSTSAAVAAGCDVLVAYPGCIAASWAHSDVANWLNMGKGFVQVSDWGSWFPWGFVAIPKQAIINVTLATYHEIESGLPSSWLTHGYWYYEPAGSSFIGWDTNTSDLNIAKATYQSNTYNRAVSVETFGPGRAVFIGFNVYGSAADVHSLQLFRNAIRWTSPRKKITWQYHFQLSGYADQIWVNITSQAGGTLIYGYDNLTSFSVGYPASILGWASGNSFYLVIDYQDEPTPGYFDMAFLVGTISTRTAEMYRTVDGLTWVGPTAVTLTLLSLTGIQDSAIASSAGSSVDAQTTFQYHFIMSPYPDRVYTNVTSQPGGSLLNGYANLTVMDPGYPATMLGWASGNNFYVAFDYRDVPGYYDMSLLVGTISTRTGKLYRTIDGLSWNGPTSVTLVPF
jgi:hypothetical protein